MKLSALKINCSLFNSNTNRNKPCNDRSQQTEYKSANLNLPYYPNFKSIEENDYLKAKKYLEYKKSQLSKPKLENISLKYFDLDKLNGIQKGIKIFEGLEFKQIAFVLDKLLEIATFRGCYNNCAHCYAEAKPPMKETNNFISKIDWDDFTNLLAGINELNKRLGFNIIKNNLNGFRYMTSFHDADCSQIEIKDKKGNIHDWYEIAKLQYETTQKLQLFDTAGWYIQDKSAQKRVESYVQKILADDKSKFEINISANPYHSMRYRAIEHMKTGNKEKENFFRKKESERMANVLFTLTPLLNDSKDNTNLCFITRAMSNGSKNSKGFSVSDLKQTFASHFEELKKLYIKDYETEQKIIKNKHEINKNINEYKKLLIKNITTSPSVTNKLKDLYDENDKNRIYSESKNIQNPKEINQIEYATVIDINGDVYLTNFYETYKTDIQLNFKNKDKDTANIKPNLCDKIFTSNLIKKS